MRVLSQAASLRGGSPLSTRRVCRTAALLLLLLGSMLCATGCETSTTESAPEDAAASEGRGEESPFQISVSRPKEQGAEQPGGGQPLRSPRFTDVHETLGVEFQYVNGAVGQVLMVEAIGGGAGWLDYDADGRPDLFLCQGGRADRDPQAGDPADQLFRNTGPRGFENVTEQARLSELRYGQGVAVGDFDNDGFDDVYVTNVGGNSLFHNQGDGTFLEVAADAGVEDPRWSSSAAWADLDHDGDLDLYVCNYTDYDPRDPLECKDAAGRRRICHPSDVPPAADECFINQGDGSFTAESRARGLFGPGNRALGVAAADFNNDGLIDIYVANDTTENFLFLNQGDGRFRESATLLGCAVDHRGHRQASMGLAVGDFDDNGYLDIYSTHYYEESNTLYRNLGEQGFEDITGAVGLHTPTMPLLGFGTVMTDFNLDGRDELFVTNGHIDPAERVYEMRPQLFAWNGSGWQEWGTEAGEFFAGPRIGRGVAAADFDGDGDLDLAVVHQDAPTALLRNESQRGHWLQLRFRGSTSNRRGIGVRATVRSASRSRTQQLCGGTSFAATHEPLLVFGLGADPGPVSVEVAWPSGRRTQLDGVNVDRQLLIEEPRG